MEPTDEMVERVIQTVHAGPAGLKRLGNIYAKAYWRAITAMFTARPGAEAGGRLRSPTSVE